MPEKKERNSTLRTAQKFSRKGTKPLGEHTHTYIWCIPADQVEKALGIERLSIFDESGIAYYASFQSGSTGSTPVKICKSLGNLLLATYQNISPRETVHYPEAMNGILPYLEGYIGEAYRVAFPPGYERGYSRKKAPQPPKFRSYSHNAFQYWLRAEFLGIESSCSDVHTVMMLPEEPIQRLDTVGILWVDEYRVPVMRLPLLYVPVPLEFHSYLGRFVNTEDC